MKTTYLFLLILTSLSYLGCSESKEVDSSEETQIIENEIWIDVRSAEEYASGHLEQATNIPHKEITDRIGELTNDKTASIHVYCRSGNRSARAQIALETIGFTNVTNEGGYSSLIQKETNPTH